MDVKAVVAAIRAELGDGSAVLGQLEELEAVALGSLADVEKLKGNNADLLKQLRGKREALDAFEGLDAEDVRAQLRKVSELTEALDAAKGDESKALRAQEERHSTELAKVQGKLDKALQRARDGALDRALVAALADGKVIDAARDPLSAMFRTRASVNDDGDEYTVEIDGRPLTDVVAEYCKSEAAKPFIAASGNSGGGGTGSGGGVEGGEWEVHFKPDSRNMTKVLELYKSNPDLAKQLAKKHGVPMGVDSVRVAGPHGGI